MNDKVYIMLSMWRPWFYKVGVSNRVDLREKQVKAKAAIRVPFPFIAYSVEGAMLRYLKFSNVRFSGDGGSEWHFTVNPLAALLFFNLQLWYGILPDAPPWAPFAVLLFPFPVDALLVLLFVTALVYIGIPAAIIGLIYGANLLTLAINA